MRGSGEAASTTFQAALADLNAFASKHGGRVSALAVDLASGAPQGEWQAKLELNPASTMKLLTAAAALELLGPSYQFQTGLYGVPRPVVSPTPESPSSALQVDELVLRGDGDPTLEVQDLWRLANALANMGVTQVGKLFVDQSRFDQRFVPPGFEQQPNEWAAFRAPVSAIALNRNSVTLNVLPTQPGRPARLWIEPPSAVSLDGTVSSVDKGNAKVNFQVVPSGLGDAPPVAKVSGHLPIGQGRARYTRRMDDPTLTAGFSLRDLLRQHGITVGDVTTGGQHEKRRITYHASPPLSAIVHALGKDSDNFTAEMLLKTLATVQVGADGRAPVGSSTQGAEVVRNWLSKLEGFEGHPHIRNGSGLFDANRLSAAQLVAVLRHAYRTPSVHPDFVAQLSEGGVDGTLRARFREPNVRGRVRAKTGTLQRVVSLCGYALRDGIEAPVAFAILVTDVDGKHAELRALVDKAVATLLPPRPPGPSSTPSP
jgi:D-alanyl-D-alanine carboxypeptidase/D-alanyl-D-alanine-endopeptidase (penicillin-binding protein 4)